MGVSISPLQQYEQREHTLTLSDTSQQLVHDRNITKSWQVQGHASCGGSEGERVAEVSGRIKSGQENGGHQLSVQHRQHWIQGREEDTLMSLLIAQT